MLICLSMCAYQQVDSANRAGHWQLRHREALRESPSHSDAGKHVVREYHEAMRQPWHILQNSTCRVLENDCVCLMQDSRRTSIVDVGELTSDSHVSLSHETLRTAELSTHFLYLCSCSIDL